MPFGTEKLEWCGYQRVKKIDDIFIHFDKIHERDGQTDRQKPHDDIGRACIIIALQKAKQATKQSRNGGAGRSLDTHQITKKKLVHMYNIIIIEQC